MRYFSLVALLLGLLSILMFSSSAKASVLSSHLTFDGVPDTIDDDSRADFFNADGSVNLLGIPTFTPGDIVYGFISVSDFTPTGTAAPDEIATVFSATITGVTAVGAFSLSPTPLGGAYSLDTLLGPGFVAANPGALPVGSIGVVVDLSGVDPLAPEVADPAGAGALGAPFPGIFELTVGFSSLAVPDSTGAVNPLDFFHYFPGPFAPGVPGLEAAGLSVLAFGAFPTVSLIPVTAPRFDPLLFSLHDVSLFSGSVSPNPLAPPVGASTWAFVDNSDFLVNPPFIPEPTSLLIWGLGVAVAAGLAIVRRRRLAR